MNKSPQEGFHPLCMMWSDEAIISEGHLILKSLDNKVLYSATRPKKVQEFIDVQQFMSSWVTHRDAFEKQPPEIALVYSAMSMGKDEIAYAIPIKLSSPIAKEDNSWQFDLSFPEKGMASGIYKDVALFIDWLPSSLCPEPIKLLFPESVL